MSPSKRAYYLLTAYVPRKLPTTNAEYEAFLAVLKEAYDVTDEPSSWAAVAGQIKSTPAHKIRKPWGHIANAAKRLKTNAVAHGMSIMAGHAMQAQALKAAEDAAERERLQREKDASPNIIQDLDQPAGQDAPPPLEQLQGS